MIMPREKREIQKNDIMPLDVYTKQRKGLRKTIVEFKKEVYRSALNSLRDNFCEEINND